jgi:hypothetical protein
MDLNVSEERQIVEYSGDGNEALGFTLTRK